MFMLEFDPAWDPRATNTLPDSALWWSLIVSKIFCRPSRMRMYRRLCLSLFTYFAHQYVQCHTLSLFEPEPGKEKYCIWERRDEIILDVLEDSFTARTLFKLAIRPYFLGLSLRLRIQIQLHSRALCLLLERCYPLLSFLFSAFYSHSDPYRSWKFHRFLLFPLYPSSILLVQIHHHISYRYLLPLLIRCFPCPFRCGILKK